MEAALAPHRRLPLAGTIRRLTRHRHLQQPEGDIFCDSAEGGLWKTLSNPATSSLNLIGKLEGWGIGPETPGEGSRDQGARNNRRATEGATEEAAGWHDLRAIARQGGQLMVLDTDQLRALTTAEPADAWRDHYRSACITRSVPNRCRPGSASGEVTKRDRAVGSSGPLLVGRGLGPLGRVWQLSSNVTPIGWPSGGPPPTAPRQS